MTSRSTRRFIIGETRFKFSRHPIPQNGKTSSIFWGLFDSKKAILSQGEAVNRISPMGSMERSSNDIGKSDKSHIKFPLTKTFEKRQPIKSIVTGIVSDLKSNGTVKTKRTSEISIHFGFFTKCRSLTLGSSLRGQTIFKKSSTRSGLDLSMAQAQRTCRNYSQEYTRMEAVDAPF